MNQSELKAENARLRVCGTCGHADDPGDGGLWCCFSGTANFVVACTDSCHFDHGTQLEQPRWTPYWEKP